MASQPLYAFRNSESPSPPRTALLPPPAHHAIKPNPSSKESRVPADTGKSDESPSYICGPTEAADTQPSWDISTLADTLVFPGGLLESEGPRRHVSFEAAKNKTGSSVNEKVKKLVTQGSNGYSLVRSLSKVQGMKGKEKKSHTSHQAKASAFVRTLSEKGKRTLRRMDPTTGGFLMDCTYVLWPEPVHKSMVSAPISGTFKNGDPAYRRGLAPRLKAVDRSDMLAQSRADRARYNEARYDERVQMYPAEPTPAHGPPHPIPRKPLPVTSDMQPPRTAGQVAPAKSYGSFHPTTRKEQTHGAPLAYNPPSPPRETLIVGDPNRLTTFGDFLDAGVGSSKSPYQPKPRHRRTKQRVAIAEPPTLKMDEDDEYPAVVIDTFVHEKHTSWHATSKEDADAVRHHSGRLKSPERPSKVKEEEEEEDEKEVQRNRQLSYQQLTGEK